MAQATNMDQQEQVARIERTQAETRKFAAEANKLTAEMLKLSRDYAFAPWQIVATSAAATAALIGAGVALAKLFP